jgi:predicted aspartyl protease
MEWSYLALIDTGAEFTIVPSSLLRSINPPAIRPAILSTQWQDKRPVYVYKVDLQIGDITLPAIDVAADPLSEEILLGRNVLNRLDLRLEGPAFCLHVLE